jgi:hypothetical protein
LEKGRIEQRVGYQARMHNMNAPKTSAMLTSLHPGDAGYIANSDRFHTDTVGEFREERQNNHEKQLQIASFRRTKAANRESDKYAAAEAKEVDEEEKFRQWREDGSKSRKNTSNMAYDITTLEYDQNIIGEAQKYADDMVRYRSALRTNNIILRGDTRVPYNILNGSEMAPRPAPIPANKPQGTPNDGGQSGRLSERRQPNNIF